MSYQLALMSEIELVEKDGAYWTLDLWAQDLQTQVAYVKSVTLFSPIAHQARAGWTLLPVPAPIRVVALDADGAVLQREIAAADVLQIPGNFTWRRSRRARSFVRMARQTDRPVILGISSDRATTLVVNARGKSLSRRILARLGSLSIKLSQRYLASRCDGKFVVGEGLRTIVGSASPNLFVGTASWIRHSDILPARADRRDPSTVRLCVAARLEPMKGIDLALDAVATMIADSSHAAIALLIAGQGPQEEALREKSRALNLEGIVTFAGSFSYPGPFFELLRRQDVVVLTNLNDEQPRLVFDSVSQGALIVCPDSVPYKALGIPAELLYRKGDAAALALVLQQVIGRLDDLALRERLTSLARDATIESMHERRAEWVRQVLIGHRP